jgi:hypothetical protein
MKFRNLSSRTMIKFLFIVIAILCMGTSTASATTRNLTVTLPAPGPTNTSIVIVDQASGAVDFCNAYLHNGAGPPVGSCTKIGHTAESTVEPIAPTGLSVFLQQQNGGTLFIWIVNNQTGDVTVCADEACVNAGIAP